MKIEQVGSPYLSSLPPCQMDALALPRISSAWRSRLLSAACL